MGPGIADSGPRLAAGNEEVALSEATTGVRGMGSFFQIWAALFKVAVAVPHSKPISGV
jgi:hypothetical protein